jgi:hypothetical protein
MSKLVIMLITINEANKTPQLMNKFIKDNNIEEENFISKITKDGVNYLIEK